MIFLWRVAELPLQSLHLKMSGMGQLLRMPPRCLQVMKASLGAGPGLWRDYISAGFKRPCCLQIEEEEEERDIWASLLWLLQQKQSQISSQNGGTEEQNSLPQTQNQVTSVNTDERLIIHLLRFPAKPFRGFLLFVPKRLCINLQGFIFRFQRGKVLVFSDVHAAGFWNKTTLIKASKALPFIHMNEKVPF